MDTITIEHAHSPENLIVVNKQIAELIASKIPDATALSDLIEKRHNIVSGQLSTLTGEDLTEFASAEWSIQQELQSEIGTLFEHARDDIANYLKAKKAVSNYK